MTDTHLLQILRDILPLIIPVVLIQLALIVIAFVDLVKRTRVHGGKTLWALILLVTTFGVPSGIVSAAIYLGWARHVEE